MSPRKRRMMVRLVLAGAVAALIVYRYTSPRTIFQPAAHEQRR